MVEPRETFCNFSIQIYCTLCIDVCTSTFVVHRFGSSHGFCVGFWFKKYIRYQFNDYYVYIKIRNVFVIQFN